MNKLIAVSLLSLAACGQNPSLVDAPLTPPGTVPGKRVHCEMLINRSALTTPKTDMVPSPLAFKGDLAADFDSVSFGHANSGETLTPFLGTAFNDVGDNFAMRCTMTVTFSYAGNYKFTMGSDDGSALYIDQRSLISNNGNHAFTSKTVTLKVGALELGAHTLVVLYAQGTGPKGLTLSVQEPAIIPAGQNL